MSGSAAAARTPSAGLRFAFVSTFYPPYSFGGDAVSLRRLAHALAGRGHSVDVIHDEDAYRLHRQEDPQPLDEPDGVTVHRLRSRAGRLSCLLTHQTGRPLVHGRTIRTLLDSGSFDVIHFHNLSLVGGPGALAYGDAIKLYTAHEHWLVCPTHVLWRHNRELCTARQCVRCCVHHRRPPQLWRYTGLLERKLRHVDAFISPSDFSAAKHREFGFPRDFSIVPYFVPEARDESGSTVTTNDGAADRPYVLFAGRLEKIKGLQDLIPIFTENPPCELRVAGAGDLEPELRRLAGDSPSVTFLGELPQQELGGLLAGARALVVPSLCYETFGIVLIEAFRKATPVIARRLGPMIDLIDTSGGGVLFDDRAELRDAIEKLVSDDSLHHRLAKAGRAAYEENWSEDPVLQQYLRLIEDLARSRGDGRIIELLKGVA